MRLKGQLRLYMQLPMVMAILLIVVNIWIFSIDRRAGMVMFIFVIIYIGMVIFLYMYSRAGILKDLVEFAAQYGIWKMERSSGLMSSLKKSWEKGSEIYISVSLFRSLIPAFSQRKRMT